MKDKPGFFYQYTVCDDRFFFKDVCKLEREEYDINDDKVRIKLKEIGFKLKVF